MESGVANALVGMAQHGHVALDSDARAVDQRLLDPGARSLPLLPPRLPPSPACTGAPVSAPPQAGLHG